jgi:hypothetical protein
MDMTDHWQELRFGKYIGMTAPQIALRDPDWIFWAVGNAHPGPFSYEIATVAYRAQSILLPPLDGVPQMVEYIIDPLSGKLVNVEVISYPNAVPSECSRVLDLSYARRCHPYDKLGGRRLVEAVKRYVLGVNRITRDIADTFFADACNFAFHG